MAAGRMHSPRSNSVEECENGGPGHAAPDGHLAESAGEAAVSHSLQLDCLWRTPYCSCKLTRVLLTGLQKAGSEEDGLTEINISGLDGDGEEEGGGGPIAALTGP